jgi:hypothetical protein
MAASDGVLRVRAKLNARLKKSGEAVKRAEKGLIAVMGVYRKAHDVAAKRNKLLSSAKHAKLINGVLHAQNKLGDRYRERIAIEEEWKEYFRPAK